MMMTMMKNYDDHDDSADDDVEECPTLQEG